MKRSIIYMLALTLAFSLILSGCSGKSQNYEDNGYWVVYGADTEYLELIAPPIPRLFLSDDVNCYLKIFEQQEDGSFLPGSPNDYSIQQTSEYDFPKASRRDASGALVAPEQFYLYTSGDTRDYAVSTMARDAGYTATADGSKMIYLSSSGQFMLYDADSDTLRSVGSANYNEQPASYYSSWVYQYCMDETATYVAFTSNRRTFTGAGLGEEDIWLLNLKTGEETLLVENIATPATKLFFQGQTVWYTESTDVSGETEKQICSVNINTGKQSNFPWDGESLIQQGDQLISKTQIFDLDTGSNIPVNTSVLDDSTHPDVVLSDDGNSLIGLYIRTDTDSETGEEHSGLFLYTTEISTGNQVYYYLPSAFLENFVTFRVLSLGTDHIALLQASPVNSDNSGSYTYYYTIDLSVGYTE